MGFDKGIDNKFWKYRGSIKAIPRVWRRELVCFMFCLFVFFFFFFGGGGGGGGGGGVVTSALDIRWELEKHCVWLDRGETFKEGIQIANMKCLKGQWVGKDMMGRRCVGEKGTPVAMEGQGTGNEEEVCFCFVLFCLFFWGRGVRLWRGCWLITPTQVMVYHWWIPCETLVHTGSR